VGPYFNHYAKRLLEGEAMFLVFPKSMMIPEILEHLEAPDFDDWLTATLIEKGSQQLSGDMGFNGNHLSAIGMADLWMLEVAQRTGRVWRGKFQVAFAKTDSEQPDSARLMEQEAGEVHFAFDTTSAEITFSPT
jgi:hypothetical protein